LIFKGQRVATYPPTLDKREEVLATGDTSLDPEPSHEVAYQRIFEAYMSFESPPKFYRSDSTDLAASEIGEKVPLWMHTAKQISVGGRRQVLEDGADVCNSESDSENEDHGEILTGMYTSDIPVDQEGVPLTSAYKLTPEQAAVLRWAAKSTGEFSGSTVQALASDPSLSTTLLPAAKLAPEVPVKKSAKKLALPAPSRIEGAGEPVQGKSGRATRSRTEQEKRDQRASTELVPVTKKRASRAGSSRAVLGSG
jgi:hypothetical protein